MTEISPETFNHLVSLAALKLDDAESEYLRNQLNKQLKAVDELGSIPLDPGIPPASHGVPYPREIRPALREDIWLPCPDSASILGQSPEIADNYFVVPDIPHTKLE